MKLSTRRSQIAMAVVAALLAGTGGTVVWLREKPSAVSLDDAVAQFRGDAQAAPSAGTAEPAPDGGPAPGPAADPAAAPDGTAAPNAPGQPAPAAGPAPAAMPGSGPAPGQPPAVGSRWPDEGVYSFRTEGGGETNALGGARHDYPAEVPVIVRRGGCGYTVRWQPLNERWDEWEFCADGASRPMARISTYHEFFQRGQRQDFACNHPEMLPAGQPPGSTQQWECQSANSKVVSTTTVVGNETLEVGGQQAQVLHVRYDVTFSGANEGSQQMEWWLHLDTGLPLKMARDLTVKSDSPFGKVDYRERFTSAALSLTPRR